VGLGSAGQGWAWHGVAWLGAARHREARQGVFIRSSWRGAAGPGLAGRGWARQGKEFSMPKKLKSFRFTPRGSERWNDCIHGPVLFVRGEDYKTHDDVFRTCAYSAARARGMQAKTQSMEDGMVVQFFKRNT